MPRLTPEAKRELLRQARLRGILARHTKPLPKKAKKVKKLISDAILEAKKKKSLFRRGAEGHLKAHTRLQRKYPRGYPAAAGAVNVGMGAGVGAYLYKNRKYLPRPIGYVAAGVGAGQAALGAVTLHHAAKVKRRGRVTREDIIEAIVEASTGFEVGKVHRKRFLRGYEKKAKTIGFRRMSDSDTARYRGMVSQARKAGVKKKHMAVQSSHVSRGIPLIGRRRVHTKLSVPTDKGGKQWKSLAQSYGFDPSDKKVVLRRKILAKYRKGPEYKVHRRWRGKK